MMKLKGIHNNIYYIILYYIDIYLYINIIKKEKITRDSHEIGNL